MLGHSQLGWLGWGGSTPPYEIEGVISFAHIDDTISILRIFSVDNGLVKVGVTPGSGDTNTLAVENRAATSNISVSQADEDSLTSKEEQIAVSVFDHADIQVEKDLTITPSKDASIKIEKV